MQCMALLRTCTRWPGCSGRQMMQWWCTCALNPVAFHDCANENILYGAPQCIFFSRCNARACLLVYTIILQLDISTSPCHRLSSLPRSPPRSHVSRWISPPHRSPTPDHPDLRRLPVDPRLPRSLQPASLTPGASAAATRHGVDRAAGVIRRPGEVELGGGGGHAEV